MMTLPTVTDRDHSVGTPCSDERLMMNGMNRILYFILTK